MHICCDILIEESRGREKLYDVGIGLVKAALDIESIDYRCLAHHGVFTDIGRNITIGGEENSRGLELIECRYNRFGRAGTIYDLERDAMSEFFCRSMPVRNPRRNSISRLAAAFSVTTATRTVYSSSSPATLCTS